MQAKDREMAGCEKLNKNRIKVHIPGNDYNNLLYTPILVKPRVRKIGKFEAFLWY